MATDGKLPGPLLQSVYKGLRDLFPPEWQAKLGLRVKVQENPLEVDADNLTGNLIESKVEQSRTNERKKTNTEIEGDLNDTMVSEERLPNGQIATRTRRLVPEGTGLDAPVDAIEGTQKNLGNAWLDQYIIEAGLPGPTIYTTRLDPDGEVVAIAETRKLIANINEGETVASGIWTRTYRKGETDLVATEIVESRSIQE